MSRIDAFTNRAASNAIAAGTATALANVPGAAMARFAKELGQGSEATAAVDRISGLVQAQAEISHGSDALRNVNVGALKAVLSGLGVPVRLGPANAASLTKAVHQAKVGVGLVQKSQQHHADDATALLAQLDDLDERILKASDDSPRAFFAVEDVYDARAKVLPKLQDLERKVVRDLRQLQLDREVTATAALTDDIATSLMGIPKQ